jgi:hypothetical protein
MKGPRIFLSLLLLGITATSFGQKKPSTTNEGYVRLKTPVNVNVVKPPSGAIRLVLPKGATTTRGLVLMDSNSGSGGFFRAGASKPEGEDNHGPNITGLDTAPTFTGAFASPFNAIDPFLNGVFPFVMIGNQPLLGGTTELNANITAVSLQLLNPDNSVFANVPFKPFEDLTEDSPVFRDANYSVGRTQFGDAIQRAEFFNMMEESWHTRLNPRYVNRVALQIPFSVQLVFPDNTVKTVRTYFTQPAADGSTVVFLLDLVFNLLDTNQVINDINGGNFTTKAVNYHLYPNTFLFSIVDEQLDTVCCTLGFHTYFLDPTATPQPRWIYAFASWMSPGTFPPGVQDVTALSHETSELLNDPFGNNIVPTWQFPGVPANDNVDCQANLETGDPIEVLPNETVPIVTREQHEVFTYHPQTEALLQWFENGATSNAIGGAFSYPNTTVLTHSAIPCPL